MGIRPISKDTLKYTFILNMGTTEFWMATATLFVIGLGLGFYIRGFAGF